MNEIIKKIEAEQLKENAPAVQRGRYRKGTREDQRGKPRENPGV